MKLNLKKKGMVKGKVIILAIFLCQPEYTSAYILDIGERISGNAVVLSLELIMQILYCSSYIVFHTS